MTHMYKSGSQGSSVIAALSTVWTYNDTASSVFHGNCYGVETKTSQQQNSSVRGRISSIDKYWRCRNIRTVELALFSLRGETFVTN